MSGDVVAELVAELNAEAEKYRGGDEGDLAWWQALRYTARRVERALAEVVVIESAERLAEAMEPVEVTHYDSVQEFAQALFARLCVKEPQR